MFFPEVSCQTLQVFRVREITPKWFRITIEEGTCGVAEKICWLEKGVLLVFWTWWGEAQVATGPQVFKSQVKRKKVLVTQLCPTLCEPIDCSLPLSIEFSRQEYRSGLPFPSPGDLPDPGIEPRSPSLQADSLPSGFPDSSVGKESACDMGDPSLIPGSRRSTGEGIGSHSSILGLPLWLSW